MTNDGAEALFLGLVAGLAESAMLQLGKFPHPLTGKCERDLAGARQTIDLLLALQAKTRGNLTAREARLLQDTLTSVQLTFVHEQAAPAAESAPPAAPPDKPRIIIP